MTDVPDLRYHADFVMTFTFAVAGSLSETGSGVEIIAVSADTERGHDFLLAYNEATEGKYLSEVSRGR